MEPLAMRGVLIGALMVVGCSDDPPSGPGIDSHVESYDLPGTTPPKLDLLIVIDHTAGMLPYQSALTALPAGIAAELEGTGWDFRLAVTTTDPTGTWIPPVGVADPYLASTYSPRLEPVPNYSNQLGDQIAEMLVQTSNSAIAPQPLAAVIAALDGHPDFIRPFARLGVMIVSSADDSSTATVMDLATALHTRKPAVTDVITQLILAGIYPKPQTRLDSYFAMFSFYSSTIELTTTNFMVGIAGIETLPAVDGYPLFPIPADVDATTPGAQYDCDLHIYFADDTTERLPQCVPNGPGKCFSFVADADGLGRLELRGFPSQYHPPVRGQCVVEGS